jgi:DNA-binding SARP family transcriptional activator
VGDFQRALVKAEKERGAQRELYLRQAVSLYEGDYLEDVYADWTVELRGSLRREYLRSLEALALHNHQEGRLGQAAEYCRKLLDKDPLREDVHRLLMRVLAQAGDRAGAIRQCDELRTVLREELGAEPSTETAELYEKLLAAGG